MLDFLLKYFVKDYKHIEKKEVRERYGLFSSFFGLASNFLLFLVKIVIGIILSMPSILADAINNFSDFGNNFLSIFGFKISAKKADKEHPFGHQRVEYIISIVIACVIIGLGMVMAYQGITNLIQFFKSVSIDGTPLVDDTFIDKNGNKNVVLFIVTLCLLSFSICVKLSQSFLYHSLGKRINSIQLEALSKDSRNDVISTFLVIIGILITWFTSYNVDCFFTISVSILVIASGIGIIKDAANILIGEKPKQEIINSLAQFISSKKDIYGVHDLIMHSYGQMIYASIHVEVDGSKSVLEAHEQIDIIEREVLGKFNVILTIHMDPILLNNADTDKYKEAINSALNGMDYNIKMHDFRIIPAKNFDNLIFDLVIPQELNDDNGHKMIRQNIQNKTKGLLGKDTYLIINFDDFDSDFLSQAVENLEK